MLVAATVGIQKKQDSDRFISDFAHAQKKEEKQGSEDPEHG